MYLPRVWLITGASSGLGKALTEVALRYGDIVVATLRDPSVLAPLSKQYPPSQLLLLGLDVTDISAALERTRHVFGRLDVVFNNAGYMMFSEIKGTLDADARALFDVNFWGLVNVGREAVKYFRELNPPGKGGILLQNSSVMLFVSGPGVSFYFASKHTVVGFSESPSKELSRVWNIQICILQTGDFDTNTIAAGGVLPIHPAYVNTSTAVLREARNEWSFEGDPNEVAEMLHQLVEGADGGERMPLFSPVEKDALERLRVRLNKLGKRLEDVERWSVDGGKDTNIPKAKL